MRRFVIKLSQLVCVVSLAAFIMFALSRQQSDTSPQELVQAVSSQVNIHQLLERDTLFIRRELGIDDECYSYACYYSSDSVMDVRELLLMRIDEQTQQNTVGLIEKRLEQRKTLFEGYAPLESAMLESAVLVCEGGWLLYAVGEDSDEALAAFRGGL